MADDRSDRPTVRREVVANDPALSPEANRILTDELRAVVGSDVVELPAEAATRPRARHDTHSPLVVALSTHRLVLGITFLVALVVGAVIALTTGSWWLLLLPVGLDLLGMFVVAALTLQLTTETEHVSPTAAAALEQEGVADPDKVFTDLVEEHSEGREGGRDDLPTPAHEDPAKAAGEQRGAITPSQEGSKPVGP